MVKEKKCLGYVLKVMDTISSHKKKLEMIQISQYFNVYIVNG